MRDALTDRTIPRETLARWALILIGAGLIKEAEDLLKQPPERKAA